VALLTEIEPLQIEPDLPAKVVIDSRCGGGDQAGRMVQASAPPRIPPTLLDSLPLS
jgi:hypothetical protein